MSSKCTIDTYKHSGGSDVDRMGRIRPIHHTGNITPSWTVYCECSRERVIFQDSMEGAPRKDLTQSGSKNGGGLGVRMLPMGLRW